MKARRLSTDIGSILGTRAVWTVMGMATGLMLARVLGPHDRGVFALVVLLPSTVLTIAKFGISQANVYFINRHGSSATSVASNSLVLALVLGVGASLLCWLLRDSLMASFLPGVPIWAFAMSLVRVPLLLFDDYLYGVLQATGKWSVYNTRLVVSEALRVVLVGLALLVFHWGLFAAVAIYTIMTFFNVGWLAISVHPEIPFKFSLDVKLLREQIAFGAKSYVQTLTSHLLLRIDVYMVAALLKDPAQAAFYSLALRFTEMVLEIPQAVGLVLYPRLASLEESEIYQLTAQACRRTLLLSGFGAIVIGVAGPYLITVYYGADYAPAGAPLRWAAIGVVAMSIFVLLSRAFTSRHRQQVNIVAGMVALISNVVLNLFLIPSMGIVGASMATALSYSGACAVLMYAFLKQSHLSIFDVLVARREDFVFLWQTAQRSAERGRRLVVRGAAWVGR